MRPRARAAALLLATCASGAGCVRYVEPPLAPLPTLAVHEAPSVAVAPPAARYSASPDPWRGLPPGPPVTLSAVDVDVRALALALAEAAGVNMILDPPEDPGAVRRITVNLVEIPALEALRQVLDAAELSVAATAPPPPLFEPVVFYVLPVDIERADTQLIRSRFRVSEELARFVVETRIR